MTLSPSIIHMPGPKPELGIALSHVAWVTVRPQESARWTTPASSARPFPCGMILANRGGSSRSGYSPGQARVS
jgi:hypothetical protein